MSSVPQPCMLGYPERFESSVKFIKMNAGKPLSQETQLLLYALEQQATMGSCNVPKPGGWGWGSAEEIAKWQSWKHLGNMNRMEAMRLYVRTVEEEEADWYGLLLKVGSMQKEVSEGGGQVSGVAAAEVLRPAADLAVHSSWTPVPQGSQRKPLPRYEHASALLPLGGGSLFVVGGNYAGRYLSDVWRLDVQSMVWSLIPTRPFMPSEGGQEAAGAAVQQGLPAIAGHTITPWQDTLIIVGGHSKAKDAPASIPVYVMDTMGDVAVLSPHGGAPCPRGGHTANLIGRRLYVFAGEDPHRRPLGDLWYLDLDTMTWGQPEVSGIAPLPRSAHTATAYQDRYLVVFGGGTIANCFGDIHVLDTHSAPMTWTQLSASSMTGRPVTPRAGHTGIVVGTVWYIVGGGNNVKGCTEMLALDMTGLPSGSVTWHSVASIPIRDPLSSEGVSLGLLPGAGGGSLPGAHASPLSYNLLSFGGYNGKYQNAVSVIKVHDFLPAAAVESSRPSASSQSQSHVPPVGKDLRSDSQSSQINRTASETSTPKASAPPAAVKPPSDAQMLSDLRSQLEAARRDAEAALREAASAKESAGHELALLRKDLNKAHASSEEASRGHEETKRALVREREKVMKLEAEVAELNKRLGAAAELQKEVESLRRVVKEAEVKAKNSAGVWGYLSGQ